MEYVLKTRGLSKTYRNFRSLDGINMNVPKGSIYGFAGRNGAGKTTLIRIICGLQKQTSGDYTLYGCDSNDRKIRESRRRIGAVVERPSVYEELTAEENLIEQFRILGIPSFDGVYRLLELVGLKDTGKKKVKNFSLGMKQRLGIAVALAGDPDFLILDEPVNGLDPQGIIEIRELILKLNREYMITVLISSHILDELARIATHYGFIDRGRIVKEISAEELQKVCRKCIRVKVSDIRVLSGLMEKMNMEYSIESEDEAEIYGNVDITEFVTLLAEEKCRVLSIKEKDETLESYFVNLVGGDDCE